MMKDVRCSRPIPGIEVIKGKIVDNRVKTLEPSLNSAISSTTSQPVAPNFLKLIIWSVHHKNIYGKALIGFECKYTTLLWCPRTSLLIQFNHSITITITSETLDLFC